MRASPPPTPNPNPTPTPNPTPNQASFHARLSTTELPTKLADLRRTTSTSSSSSTYSAATTTSAASAASTTSSASASTTASAAAPAEAWAAWELLLHPGRAAAGGQGEGQALGEWDVCVLEAAPHAAR